jgi:cell filamentation protein, protein adenylyltransferase
MYEVDDDTYCYPGTTVLRNLLDLTTQAELDAFEAEITLQRSTEPLGSLPLGHAAGTRYGGLGWASVIC